MTNASPAPRRPKFRARYLIAALYIAVGIALVWMISRPSPSERTPAPATHQAQTTDQSASRPPPAGRRPAADTPR